MHCRKAKTAPADVVPEATEIDATATARKLAEESGIDLATIKGSGKEGRILKSDIDAVIKAQGGA